MTSSPRLQWCAVLLLLLMGGADVYGMVGYRALEGRPFSLSLLGVHPEFWANATQKVPIEFSSIVTALSWVPHQAIPTFLVAGLLIAPDGERRLPALLVAFGALSLCSPYGLIGLLPLMLVTAYGHRRELLRRTNLLAGTGGACFALLVAAYLSTDLPTGGACFACLPGRVATFHELAPFLAIELLPFGLILGRRLWSDVMCRTAFATLVPLPLLYGETGDLVMRASLGPLFVLALVAVQTVICDWIAARRRIVHTVALMLCAPTAITEGVYLRTAGHAHLAFSESDPLHDQWLRNFAYGDRFTMEQFLDRCGWQYRSQYVTPRAPLVLRPANTPREE